jgi:hypothetical protein
MKSIEIAPLSETELELTRALINAVLSTSATIDKVATWLLAGLGATVALIVANLDKTSSLVGVEQLREVIMLLLAAGLFGFAENILLSVFILTSTLTNRFVIAATKLLRIIKYARMKAETLMLSLTR